MHYVFYSFAVVTGLAVIAGTWWVMRGATRRGGPFGMQLDVEGHAGPLKAIFRWRVGGRTPPDGTSAIDDES